MSNKDTIYRQAAIDALADYIHNVDKVMGTGHLTVDDCKDAAHSVLEELPSAQPEDKCSECDAWNQYKNYPQQRWIPCSERLPEESGRYLVTRGLNACGALWNRVYIVNYSDLMGLKSGRIWWDGNVGKSDFERIDDVAAWMPLTKPWKGENR